MSVVLVNIFLIFEIHYPVFIFNLQSCEPYFYKNSFYAHNFKVRTETSAEDVGGMHAAVGILTARGGMTSHAAVVARGWGKCCVAGCSSIHVNDADKVISNLTYKSLPAHI